MVQKFQRREAKDGDGEPEEGEEGYDPDKGEHLPGLGEHSCQPCCMFLLTECKLKH